MSLKYEPSSEPLHISAKWLFLDCELYRSVQLSTPEEKDIHARYLKVCHSPRWRQPSSQFKNNLLAEMWSGSQEGSYFRLINCCITQL